MDVQTAFTIAGTAIAFIVLLVAGMGKLVDLRVQTSEIRTDEGEKIRALLQAEAETRRRENEELSAALVHCREDHIRDLTAIQEMRWENQQLKTEAARLKAQLDTVQHHLDNLLDRLGPEERAR